MKLTERTITPGWAGVACLTLIALALIVPRYATSPPAADLESASRRLVAAGFVHEPALDAWRPPNPSASVIDTLAAFGWTYVGGGNFSHPSSPADVHLGYTLRLD